MLYATHAKSPFLHFRVVKLSLACKTLLFALVEQSDNNNFFAHFEQSLTVRYKMSCQTQLE